MTDALSTTPLPTVHTLDRGAPREVDETTALRSFEAYVVGEMLRQALPQSETGLLSGGKAGRMYQEHLYQEFARLIAERGSFGLAAQLEGHLAREAEAAASPGAETAPETAEEKPR